MDQFTANRVSFLCPDRITTNSNWMSPDVTIFKFLSKLAMAATC